MVHVRFHPDLPTGQAGAARPDPLGMTAREFAGQWCARFGGDGRAAMALYQRVYRDGPGAWIEAGGSELVESPPADGVLSTESPEGTVVKFLTPVRALVRDAAGASAPEKAGRGHGGEPGAGQERTLHVESVVIPMQHAHDVSHTLCVSSQVGCAMGCVFCETAQMGLVRSLSAREIVAQWYAARHLLGHDVRNIVFMGMGEPLDNVDEVLKAIEILTDRRGPAIAMRRITVSTVGRIDGLLRLREAVARDGWKRLNLAVSVNAPNDEIRSAIMPVNRGMPLADLTALLRDWPLRNCGAICAEYVLIPGVNDEPGHAAQLVELLRGIRCCVNVIPYNPRRDSPWPAPSEECVDRFLGELISLGQFAKRRRTKGRQTMAACGQLGSAHVRGRRLVTPTVSVAN